MREFPVQRIRRADDLEASLFGRLSAREKARVDRLAAEAAGRRANRPQPQCIDPDGTLSR
jgi:muconolactone delta-isomerase